MIEDIGATVACVGAIGLAVGEVVIEVVGAALACVGAIGLVVGEMMVDEVGAAVACVGAIGLAVGERIVDEVGAAVVGDACGEAVGSGSYGETNGLGVAVTCVGGREKVGLDVGENESGGISRPAVKLRM